MMKHQLIAPSSIIGLLLLSAPASAEIDFAKEIKPILEQTCVRCHSGPKPKGGLSLETMQGFLKGGVEGKVVVPGKAAESKIYKAITAPKDDEARMPPEGDG